jgi:glycosyltransferase involved in cell wall biosynthesis
MERSYLVIIPAYNAASTISTLIANILNHVNKRDVVVVDDGSKDRTSALVRGFGIVVLQHPENRGKGEALKTGFLYALRNNYAAVITIDADLQHDPGLISGFIRRSDNPVGIIIGTRKRNLKNMPLARWFSNQLTSVMISVLAGQSVRDSQSGYRWISTEVLKKIELKSKRYDLEPELLIKAGRIGIKIGRVPISTIYTGGGSFINPLVDTGRFIRLMWRSLWW